VKLYTFEINQQRRIGAELDGQLVDISAAYEAFATSQAEAPTPRAIPPDMNSFVRLGPIALQAATKTLNYIKQRPAVPVGEQLIYPFEAVTILAPLRPGKILCSGINYRGHEEENPDAEMPSEPFFFAKLTSAVIGPGEPIVKPKLTQQLDYEVEFAVIIGKRMKSAPE
jgi:2-keto-4-pentenoate hydratase/2-oxohepta-3-ene-1,7-dioic acid hydratase in catechol pathway